MSCNLKRRVLLFLSPLNMITISPPIFFSCVLISASLKFLLAASRINLFSLFRLTASATRFLGTEIPTNKSFLFKSFKTKTDNSVPLNEIPLVMTLVND